MNDRKFYVGLDVGGTTMKSCVVDDTGFAYPSVSSPTEAYKGQDYGLETMVNTIKKAIENAKMTLEQISGIGVATPGPMDIAQGMILEPANLKPWKNVPVRQYIQDTFKIPTVFQNDANAAALGEYWIGAGKSYNSMVLFTLGTGIGGGIILKDTVLEGEHSHGAELGHTRIEITNPRPCGCGHVGCLEAYASATSVVKRTKEALLADEGKSSLHSFLKTPGAELTSKEIFDAAYAGDILAAKIVEDTAFYLAIGAMNMMHTINPAMIAFGGGMVAAGEPFLSRIRHHIRHLALPVPAETTVIQYAKLGSDAGMIGSAANAKMLVHPGKL